MSRRRHSARRATTHRKGQNQLSSIGLRDPRGITGKRGKKESSNKNEVDRVQHVINGHSGKYSKGVSDKAVKEWSDEMREARTVVRRADPNLVAMEIEQVNKRMEKYKVPTLGYLKEEKPEGFNRFMSTQPNNMSTTITRAVKVEQTTRLINKYDIDMISFLELGLNWKQLPPSETLASFFMRR